MPAAAPYFFINRWSVVRSMGRFCLDRKIVPGKDPRTFSQARRARASSRTRWCWPEFDPSAGGQRSARFWDRNLSFPTCRPLTLSGRRDKPAGRWRGPGSNHREQALRSASQPLSRYQRRAFPVNLQFHPSRFDMRQSGSAANLASGKFSLTWPCNPWTHVVEPNRVDILALPCFAILSTSMTPRKPDLRPTSGVISGVSDYSRINWRCSQPPGRHGKQPRSRSLPRVRRIRITIPSQRRAKQLRRRTTEAENRWHSISSASASCIFDGFGKALRGLCAGSATHRGRVERALRIHPGTADGDRGCMQEIRLRMRGEDSHQAAVSRGRTIRSDN